MFVDQDFVVGYRHIDHEYRLTNRAILGYFEDAAGIHTTRAGYGVQQVSQTHMGWFLIWVRLKVIKRPVYGERIKAVTWATGMNRLFAFRNYEAINEAGETVAISASRWVPVDVRTGTIIRLTDEICQKFGPEDKHNFDDEATAGKLREPSGYSIAREQVITTSMIDFHNHVHNTYYLDFVSEILPEDKRGMEMNEVEIYYKNQILHGETVKVLYGEENGSHFVAIKTRDEKELHALIKFELTPA